MAKTITNGVLSKPGASSTHYMATVPNTKTHPGYFSDPDMETDFRKDTDWFNSYISHLRKRRRKTLKGARVSLDDESGDDDDVINWGRATSAADKLKRKTYYEKQQDKKSKSRIMNEAPETYWTNFRRYDSKAEANPSPNERRIVELGAKRMSDERERAEARRTTHSHKDLFGADDYYRSGRDVLYRIWQERENLKERDKQLKHVLGYEDHEMELGAPRLVHDSRETTMRYTTPIHNPNSQQLVRTIISEPGRTANTSIHPSTKANETEVNKNITKYSTGTGLDLTRVTSQRPATEQRSLAPSQRPFDVPNIDEYEDRENFGQSTMLKQKVDSQQRKMDNLYDTIRSLEREKLTQESALKDMREDMRSIRDQMEFSSTGAGRQNSSEGAAAQMANRQLDMFKNEFMEQFAKMQQQINGLSSHQSKSMKNEDLISSLVSDIGDIKKLFREEISTLRMDMEDIKSQNKRMTSAFESSSNQMRDMQRKLHQVDKKCEDVTQKNSRLMRESLAGGGDEGGGNKFSTSVPRGQDPNVSGASNFEINELKQALSNLDNRILHMESTKSYHQTSGHFRDIPEEGRLMAGKEHGFTMGSNSTRETRIRDDESDSGDRGKFSVTDESSETGEERGGRVSTFDNRWSKLPLTEDVDLDLMSSKYMFPLHSAGREEGTEMSVNRGRQSSTSRVSGLGSAEDLLLLTEEMEGENELMGGEGGAETEDLTVSGAASLDDLSTF